MFENLRSTSRLNNSSPQRFFVRTMIRLPTARMTKRQMTSAANAQKQDHRDDDELIEQMGRLGLDTDLHEQVVRPFNQNTIFHKN